MDAIENVSRRHFLGGLVSTGALVLVARVLPESVWAQTVDGATRASASERALWWAAGGPWPSAAVW